MINPQQYLFSWEQLDSTDEIKRIKLVLENINDEIILTNLIRQRQGKRDDYPNLVVWNACIIRIICGHKSVDGLIRELKRNAELRDICGIDPIKGADGVPTKYVFSNFYKKISSPQYESLIKDMFFELLLQVKDLLPDFGEIAAVDSKHIHACKNTEDADWGCKIDTTTEKTTLNWYGFKIHLMVDAKYELPMAFEITKASESDYKHLLPLLEDLKENAPDIYKIIEMILADRGYDSGKINNNIRTVHGASPVIDKRIIKFHDDYKPLDDQKHDTIFIRSDGCVCCKVCPFKKEGEEQYVPMQFRGYESDRESLKFRCPAVANGFDCQNREACQAKIGTHARIVRVPLSWDERLFTPIYIKSKKFKRIYKMRTSVERVNSRIDNVHGFEKQFTRNRKTIEVQLSLVLCMMLATAIGWIKLGQAEKMRSFLKTA